MQFAVVANELNMRIAIIPKENEKSEPFSNRKQVRIFLVWWARVDYASRAAKNSLAGCFCAVFGDSAAAVRIHPWICFEKFRTKEKLQHLYDAGVFGGRGWITQAAHLKRPRRGLFAAGTYSGGRCCSNPPLRRFTNFRIKQKLQCHYNTGVLGGRGWIRTTEAEKQQIYSLSPLATREHAHIQFFAVADCLYILPLGGVFVNCFLQLFQKRS